MNQPGKVQPLLELSANSEPFNATARYHLAAIYRKAGRTADAGRELADFRELREMTQQLQEVYKELRIEPVRRERPAPDAPNWWAG
jgi:hypothetical protein